MVNSGKKFENNFKASVPSNVFYYRFRDGSGAWGGNDKVRFQASNICDCLLFDGYTLYLLELKSTKGKSLPFSNIKQHQIDDLTTASSYLNVKCGFMIEFADLDECYFIDISQFNEFLKGTDRKSIPVDYLQNNAIKIGVVKKKVNRRFDIESFLRIGG